jgi:hypothetical protein
LIVGSLSLVTRPDGSPIDPGDSLKITISVVDAGKQIVSVEPSGLKFAVGHPATLSMWYIHADHDFNGDGTIDVLDSEIESRLRIIKRETITKPFEKIPSSVTLERDRIDAPIKGFTGYAVAY